VHDRRLRLGAEARVPGALGLEDLLRAPLVARAQARGEPADDAHRDRRQDEHPHDDELDAHDIPLFRREILSPVPAARENAALAINHRARFLFVRAGR
jgi:hypothetical protein